MLMRTFRTLVHAEAETVWSILVDSMENPQRYRPDVEASRVLERLEGGIVKELKIRGMESAPGVFDFFVLDRGVLKEVKGQEDEYEHVSGVFGLFAYEGAIIMEITVRGIPYREKLLISKENREIRHELIDHPAYGGRIIVRATPTSVQNPMAPVELQFFLELEPKSSDPKEMEKWEEEMTTAIKAEQQRMKERAEEQETRHDQR